MAEYIKREALIDAVESIDWYSVYKGKLTTGAPNTENALYKANNIYAVIDNAPSADVAPVVHGRWDDSGRYTFPNGATAVRCTICGCALNESEYHLYDWNYCPICGAKMDGGDGNSDMA